MRRHIFVGAVMLVGLLAVSALASSGDRAAPAFQWAVVNLTEPTEIAGVFVMGPILITHDDTMGLGEPCTSIFKLDSTKGPQDEIVTFACIPVTRDVAEKFTITTKRDPMLGHLVLTEFQFAGDCEGHGVPIIAE